MADAKSDSYVEKRTLVEEGTEFRGSLSSTCLIVVKGKIDGEVTAPALTVSVTGSVHGRARVTDLRSMGELAGEFDADVVQLSGKVKDNTVIRAKSLEVKLTPEKGKLQVIFGECLLEVGDAPRLEETVEGSAPAEAPVAAEVAAPVVAADEAPPAKDEAPPSKKKKNGTGTLPPPDPNL